jgi:TRAP-type C4-dicarboxylate transport system permease small subunit
MKMTRANEHLLCSAAAATEQSHLHIAILYSIVSPPARQAYAAFPSFAALVSSLQFCFLFFVSKWEKKIIKISPHYVLSGETRIYITD